MGKLKPAIALAGPVKSAVVVVSAAQVQQERERAARPTVLPTRIPRLGESGRVAFDALFKSHIDEPTGSGK
ncbi:hypothetical protein [Occallatibacter riparius]|uniref:Uncharacterized protein n=1 Tax=Occallatibacter riparius TaxID=1002689 RepID=A0A9J7BTT2_9BACT|nr:hypothetical protein [Occallatibacter riparius]UWZ85154.1 hypothetical protein MOP44_04225 [Occallatibacter riparius]